MIIRSLRLRSYRMPDGVHLLSHHEVGRRPVFYGPEELGPEGVLLIGEDLEDREVLVGIESKDLDLPVVIIVMFSMYL